MRRRPHEDEMMADLSVHYKSDKSDWETPDWLFDKLNAEFGFALDVCADYSNFKTSRYFTVADNCLLQKWDVPLGTYWWMNPEYGSAKRICKPNCKKNHTHRTVYKPGIYDFILKAIYERKSGHHGVMLLPARTDTRWFGLLWDYETNKPKEYVEEIRFLKGRLKFKGAKSCAPFPSMIVVL